MKNLSAVDVITISVSILALVILFTALIREIRNGKINKRNEAEKLLNEALDSMNDGTPNTEALFIYHDIPLTQEQRPYFEEARRKIEAALNLDSSFYLGYHYMGIYVHRVFGPEKALSYYKNAVRLWENEKNTRSQMDGWPYHDLARIYERLDNKTEAEKYYKKAIEVSGDTEPDFYADFAIFCKENGKVNESLGLYEKARRISSAGHRKSNRPDLA